VNVTRQIALVTGVLFLVTFVTSIPALLLYDPVLNDATYVLGAGSDTRVELGAFLEILLAIANIGTAVTLFPLLKRQNEAIALGYVASRIVESTVIISGLISLLAVLTLRQDLAGEIGDDAVPLAIVGRALVALHERAFLIGPGFLAGFGNGLLLGYLMYASGLVPRRMALLGLIGGPVVSASGIAVLFGAYEQTAIWSLLCAIPEIAWELSLAVYLIVKGFKPNAQVLAAAPA
jgi:hypothetical protein